METTGTLDPTTTAGQRTEASAVPVPGVFGRVMFLVAAALGVTAAGAWLGRDLSLGWTLAAWAATIPLVIAMGRVRRAGGGSVGVWLLYAVSLLIGLALGPTLAHYAAVDGGATITTAAALTALAVGVLGSIGYATRRDLSGLARVAFGGLVALIGFAIVMLVVSVPAGDLIWAVGTLVVFSAFTMYDFQKLRTAGEHEAALIALAIYLDAINIFLAILELLGGEE